LGRGAGKGEGEAGVVRDGRERALKTHHAKPNSWQTIDIVQQIADIR
jgi:hypothetical protein